MLATVLGILPRSEEIGVNASVLFFTFGVSIAVGIRFSLAPALKSLSVDMQTSLKEGGRGSTSGHNRAQSSLVIVRMALTLVLLIGASLLFRTIRHLWEVNPGFNAQHVITFKVGLPPSVTKTGSSMRTAYQQLMERIRQVPGVQAADLTRAGSTEWSGRLPPLLDRPAKTQLHSGGPAGPDVFSRSGLPASDGNTAPSRPFFHPGRRHKL